MNQKLLLTLILISFKVTMYAQVSFMKVYPNNEFVSYDPSTISVAFQTDDGGYMLVANTIDNYEVDGILIKVDASGEVQWHKGFGKPDVIDHVVSGLQNRDGEYIIATTYDLVSKIYDEEVNLWRFDKNGNIITERTITYSGICCWDFSVGKILETSDGNYIFPNKQFGISTNTLGIIKVNKNGEEIWRNGFIIYDGVVNGVHESSTGDIFVYGGMGDGFVRKIDANGTALLHKYFHHPSSLANSTSSIPAIIEQTDGFLFPVNFTGENGSSTWLVKTNFNLDTIWTKTLPGTGFINGMVQNKSGRIILLGSTTNAGSDADINTILLDENYNIRTSNSFGTDNVDKITYFNKTSDGSFIVSGVSNASNSTSKDLLLLVLDSDACIRPVADFVTERESDQTGATILFKDNSKFNKTGSSAFTWQWNFGDGSTATDQDYRHTFEKQGNYIVTLVVDNGCSKDTVRKSINAACIGEPDRFSVKDTLLDVVLNYNAPSATFLNWDLGDGTTASGKEVVHRYESSGVYNVCLSTDNTCGQIRICDSVKVICPKPVLNIGNDKIACAGALVNLNASGSGYSYVWSTKETTSGITVSSSGDYWVEVKNSCGTIARDTVSVSFVTPPEIVLDDVPAVCQGEEYIFKIPNPDNYNFSWYINGAFAASGNEFSYKYTNAGEYQVKVVVSNGDCSASDSVIIKVNKIKVCKPYCVPAYSKGTTTGNYIQTIILNTINNSNSGYYGGPSYTDYYNTFETNLTVGKNYGLTTVFGGSGTDYFAVWIDLNQDGIFDNSTERMFGNVAGAGTSTYYFSLPSNTLLGETVMRVRMMNATASYLVDPCTTAIQGETEDYKVVIVPDCSLLKLTGTVTDESCAGGNGAVDVSASGGSAPYTYSWSSDAKTEDLTGLSSGTYSVTVKDDKGCTLTKSWSVKKGNNMMTVSIDTASATEGLCNGIATVNVINTSGGTITYLWNKGLSSSRSHNDLCPGTYEVRVSNTSGCSVVKEVIVGTKMISSIDRREAVSMLEIYPNPFSDDILNFEVMSDEEDAKLSLRTLSGLAVIEDESISLMSGLNKMTFSTGAIKPGVYILSITTSKGSTHRRVIKK
ncbi:PKD domain-containing protein [Sporocytophaga myxococcoides]|uniref:PKD domain-containing protein n=1 Tax=Sporocytophaga myxococcoides TaxID=153721 RepID=UPI0009DC267F|nr:T9SS type A sorting domain-containing protein [Sporocytophaga myxococcoides]